MGAPASRIVSLDQFRGYTVAGMILVNFIGDFAAAHPVWKHHNTYFSYADTIMPSFHLAVGFALRLTLLKRLATQGPGLAYFHVVRRNLGLILLSLVLTLPGTRFETWEKLQEAGAWGAAAEFLKCDCWGTLAIIGVTSLWVAPVIAARRSVRLAFLAGCMLLHLGLSYLFYFDFSYARPNWLTQFWGADNIRGLDGGPLGFLAWSIPQVLGSLAYDAVMAGSPGRTGLRLMGWALVLVGLGYGLSCLSSLYPLTQPPARDEGQIQIAPAPVWPFTEGRAEQGSLVLPRPPLVQPPAAEQRQLNYWLMCKRVVSLPFILASSGWALGVYALFVWLCDLGSLRVGIFRTFGQNPLATYVIHEMVSNAVQRFAPTDAPLAWVLGSFAVYVAITYLFVRHLEKNGIYLRM